MSNVINFPQDKISRSSKGYETKCERKYYSTTKKAVRLDNKHTEHGDNFQKSDNIKHNHSLSTKIKLKLAAALASAALVVGGGVKVADTFRTPNPNFSAGGSYTAVQVAEMTNVDERAILLANGIEYPNLPVNDIVLPESYKMFGDTIAKLEDVLQNENMSSSEREKLQKELDKFKEKQKAQDELAEVYIDADGVYAYILPNEKGISLESIKDAFGIEDGVIRNSNSNLKYTWGQDGTEDEPGYYRDYTSSATPMEGIKVRLKELGKTNG